MTVSFLVRLLPGALAESRIVGHVTAIATGVVTPVRDAGDLIAFLLASAQDARDTDTPDPAAPGSGTPLREVDAPEDG